MSEDSNGETNNVRLETQDTDPIVEVVPAEGQSIQGAVSNMIETTNLRHKLPTFWSNMPEIWFIQVEQIFSLNRITSDDSKYRNVIAVLPQETMANVLDLLRNPPRTGKYNSLKEALISRHSLSENKRLEELLSSSEIGDRSPSSLFRDMENKLGSSSFVNGDLLKRLWLRKLPEPVKVAVTSSNLEDISTILTVADRVWEVTHSNSISSVASSHTTSAIENKLLEAIKTLSVEVAALKSDPLRGRPASKSFRGGRAHSRSRSKSRLRGNYCWYHANFGNRALKCISPCQYNINKKIEPDSKKE